MKKSRPLAVILPVLVILTGFTLLLAASATPLPVFLRSIGSRWIYIASVVLVSLLLAVVFWAKRSSNSRTPDR